MAAIENSVSSLDDPETFAGYVLELGRRHARLKFKPCKSHVRIYRLFTRREGCPSKRVNSSWRVKDSPGLQVEKPYNPEQLNARLHSEGLETSRKSTRVGELTLPGVFAKEKVNLPARVTLARR